MEAEICWSIKRFHTSIKAVPAPTKFRIHQHLLLPLTSICQHRKFLPQAPYILDDHKRTQCRWSGRQTPIIFVRAAQATPPPPYADDKKRSVNMRSRTRATTPINSEFFLSSTCKVVYTSHAGMVVVGSGMTGCSFFDNFFYIRLSFSKNKKIWIGLWH